MPNSLTDRDTQWIGSEPYLRLYHALVNCRMLENCVNDGGGTLSASAVFTESEITKIKWEKVTECFNDKEWLPKSLYLPTLHPDFEKCKEIVPLSTNETPSEIFDRFQKAKSQMVALRTWCLKDQKGKNVSALSIMRSSKQDEKFSSMSAFPSHLLYLWHYSDSFKAVKDLFQLPLLVDSTPANAYSKKRAQFTFKDPGERELGTKSLRMLQSAEAHHLELVENFGYVLGKLSTVGGKYHDELSKICEDLAERINAAQQRVLNLEKAMLEG